MDRRDLANPPRKWSGFCLLFFDRSDLRRSGSSAIVMPKETAEESLASDGPEVVLSIARWFDSGAEVQDSVTQALMRSVPVEEVDVFA